MARDEKPGRRPPLPEVVDATEEKPREDDVVLLHGPTEDGRGLRALRARAGELALAEIRPAEAGKPLAGAELVRLHRREGSPLLWDVEVAFDGRAARDDRGTGHKGPARVNSPRFRQNWERIFGRRGDDPPN